MDLGPLRWLLWPLWGLPRLCTWDGERWTQRCGDLNDWCPVGPGARRGLNRLHGRPIQDALKQLEKQMKNG